ncbi:CDP-glycerol glycerophosphotransferase family protein [Virgibacillus sp. DJP39]|uniref:CDP-glycerol glycerophosphotransferase family protein n=1 Tax=Virgibacillus sp. DJP39 TaxID=3409790 RepID=UPI003BB7723D
MIREITISTYLFLFKALFSLFKLLPQQNKTVCVASFGDNIFYTTRSLSNLSDERIIILKSRRCNYEFQKENGYLLNFSVTHPLACVQSIYHLATATTILVDNYFGFLAVTNFKPGTTCIQLWHAVGALKQFGLSDTSSKTRSERSKARFRKVYSRFHFVAVGSEKMAAIFLNSFEITDDRILRTGIPRTDVFYDNKEKQEIYQKLKSYYPIISRKKVILYAPTYRDLELTNYQLQLDVKLLHQKLADDYVLFVKLHPAVSYAFDEKYDEFVYDVSGYYDSNHLMLLSDLLISDYSSVPIEFSLLNKPMIFFAYDLHDYDRTRGLLKNYQYEMPGPIVQTTEEIIKAIEQNNFDFKKIKAFAGEWNDYSFGKSSMNVAEFIMNESMSEEISL